MLELEELQKQVDELKEVINYLVGWIIPAFQYFRDPVHNPIEKTYPHQVVFRDCQKLIKDPKLKKTVGQIVREIKEEG